VLPPSSERCTAFVLFTFSWSSRFSSLNVSTKRPTGFPDGKIFQSLDRLFEFTGANLAMTNKINQNILWRKNNKNDERRRRLFTEFDDHVVALLLRF
jgi:hypothetical protein